MRRALPIEISFECVNSLMQMFHYSHFKRSDHVLFGYHFDLSLLQFLYTEIISGFSIDKVFFEAHM